MFRRHDDNNRALSLAEVLIALTLLTVAFLSVVALFARNLQLQSRAAEITECAEIGKGIMEQLKANPAVIPDPTESFRDASQIIAGPPPFPPPPFPTVEGAHGTYSVEINITETTVPNCKAVEVVVAWVGGRGVRLQTLFPE